MPLNMEQFGNRLTYTVNIPRKKVIEKAIDLDRPPSPLRDEEGLNQ